MPETIRNWLPLLLPLLVLQLGLQVAAVWDLVHREKVRGGNKWVWGAVIVLGRHLLLRERPALVAAHRQRRAAARA